MFLGEVRVFLTNYWIGLRRHVQWKWHDILLVDLTDGKVVTKALS